jgi:hypothetical protein
MMSSNSREVVVQAAIPIELREQFERRNLLLFVGEGINQGVLPLSDELAGELAGRCDYPPAEPRTLARVAGYYALTTHDRHGLIDFLQERLSRPGLEPAHCHKLIAQLQPRVVVATCYDNLLERAVENDAVSYTSVVANEEVAYSDDQKMLLVWLWGRLERPDSIIVTEDDRRRFLAGRDNLSDVLRGELARRTWLFVGFDAEDEWFRDFYDSVTRGLDRHRRRAYIVGATPSAYTRAWWAERAQILDMNAESFLTELSNHVSSRRQARPATPQPYEPVTAPLPERPYKLLDYYEAKDAAIFFGREQETQKLSALIHAHRLVLFHGASGTGKTSLLLAGVIPRLEHADPSYETLYVRALEDPGVVIRRAVGRRLPEADLPADGSLVDFLDAATESLDRPLVIVFDQFEEFFIRFSPQSRASFVDEIGRLSDARDVPVKVVFSLREDWLASMSEFEARIPEINRTKMRLLPLSRTQARRAITGPAERVGMRFDPDLVDRLLTDLADERKQGADATVMPPQLQLVCDALYDHAGSGGRQRMTLADYEAMGGTHGVLDRYIQGALREHPGEDRDVAKEALKALVTSQMTKDVADLDSIAAEVGADEATVQRVLSRLTDQRLIRRLSDRDVYELAHDVLAGTIAEWIGAEDRQLKQVRELLRRELADWRRDSTVLLSESKFRRIDTLRDGLRLTGDEAAFLLRAAILYDSDVPYWLSQVSDPGDQTDILLEMLERETPQARVTAAGYLIEFPTDEVATALGRIAVEDAEPAVRDRAAISIARMEVPAGIECLKDTARMKEDELGARVVHALALIQDVSPKLISGLSRSTHWRVCYELAKMRFGWHWPRIRMVTVAGAIGGALGLGLGLAIPVGWNQRATTFPGPGLADFVFLAEFFALPGLLAGAGLGFGMSVGASLLREKPRLGKILIGTLLAVGGFAVLLPFMIIEGGAPLRNIMLMILGSGLFGMLTGAGISVPSAMSRNRPITLVGGVAGSIAGVLILGFFGFKPFQVVPEPAVPLPLLIVGGALVGLIMAFSITWAEEHWPAKTQAHTKTDS